MTGPYSAISKFRRKRIGELTKQGLSASIIAERIGLSRGTVYELQIKHGFRKVITPRKKKNELQA